MHSAEERKRINLGLQCPECFGVYTRVRWPPNTRQRESDKYECLDCGCNWSRRIVVTS